MQGYGVDTGSWMHERRFCNNDFLCLSLQINIVTHNGRDFREMRDRKYLRDPDGRNKARYIDKLSRKLFPLAFLSFNLIYWLAYILG